MERGTEFPESLYIVLHENLNYMLNFISLLSSMLGL